MVVVFCSCDVRWDGVVIWGGRGGIVGGGVDCVVASEMGTDLCGELHGGGTHTCCVQKTQIGVWGCCCEGWDVVVEWRCTIPPCITCL